MRGLKPEMIPELVKKDIELVKKEAVFVLKIGEYGGVDIKISKEGRLNILAVIGPVQNYAIADKNICKYFSNEAVLMEVGLRRGRPYAECRNMKRVIGESTCFPYRRKWFQMSESQFLKTAPVIFRLFQEYTSEMTSSWTKKYIPGPRNWWSHRTKKLFSSTIHRLRKKAIRFSVHKKDENLLKFVYWAELNLNQSLKGYLIGLARFIDKRLKIYRENGYRKRFMELKGAQQIKRIIEQKHLPQYLLEEMLDKYIPYGEKNLLINEIAELASCNNGDKAFERRLAQSAIIPDINEIELRIVRGLEEARDYIVFELIANNSNNSFSPDSDSPF